MNKFFDIIKIIIFYGPFGLAIIIPVLYLITINIKKKKIMLGHYLLSFIIFVLFIFIGFIVINSISNEKSPGEPVIKYPQNNPPKGDNNVQENTYEDNPNYIKTTPKGYVLEKKDGAYYIDNYLIVNKTYALDKNFVPKNTYYNIGEQQLCIRCIDKEGYENWLIMKNDAQAISLNIYIASGYRSYSYQEGLYSRYIEKDGKELADTYSARPGHSEHQSGLSFDLNSVDSSFEATNEGKWVNDNAHIYGFIIRFPKDKSDETGYKYEPWHLRYVGKELAKKLYNNGDWITMETYFGIDSKYDK